MKNSIEKIIWLIDSSMIEAETKKMYLERLSKIDFHILEQAYQKSKIKITGTDIKYIICFAADMDVKDICKLFKVIPPSVYTVRYRIRKKFAKEDIFWMIL